MKKWGVDSPLAEKKEDKKMRFEEYLDLFEDMTIEEYERLTENQMYTIWCEYQNMK